MSVISSHRVRLAPVVFAASAAITIGMVGTAVTPTPHALAAELATRTEHAAVSLMASTTQAVVDAASTVSTAAELSPVQLLTASPSLGAASVHDVVGFLATPGATTPLAAALGGSAISVLAAATPADQVAGLQQSASALGSILVRFVQSILSSGPNVLRAAGDLLSGNPQSAVLDLGTILTDPLLESQDDLGALTAGLAKVFPTYAAGFNAISSNIILPALSILGVPYGGIGPGLQAIFDGTVNGLKAGNLGAALTGAVNGFQTLITKTTNAIFGDPAQGGFGLIPAFTQYFHDVAAAFAGTTGTTGTTVTLQRTAVTSEALPDAVTPPQAATDATKAATAEATDPASADATSTAATAASDTPVSASTASETSPSTDTTSSDVVSSNSASSHVASPNTTSADTATGTKASDATSSETATGTTKTTNGSTAAKSTVGASATKSTDPAKNASKDTTKTDKPKDVDKPAVAKSAATDAKQSGSAKTGGEQAHTTNAG